VIFVITGTNGPPFDRLVRAVEFFDTADPILVQRGPSAVSPSNATCVEYFSLEETEEQVRTARLIVTHGGVGSILLCLQNGKRPLVVPRLARFGEVSDDHQVSLGKRLDREGLVVFVPDPNNLPEALHSPTTLASDLGDHGTSPLVAELRRYLLGQVGAAPA